MLCPYCKREIEGMTTSECLRRTLEQGLQESALGKARYRGSFAKYAQDDKPLSHCEDALMAEGYEAMAEENLEIVGSTRKGIEMDNRERFIWLLSRISSLTDDTVENGEKWCCAWHEALAEFDRLTKRCQRIQELNHALNAENMELEPKAEALERICNRFKSHMQYGMFEEIRKACDYLDSKEGQQKPGILSKEASIKRMLDDVRRFEKPIEFDCAECGETLTVQHECKQKPYADLVCPISDAETLWGIVVEACKRGDRGDALKIIYAYINTEKPQP